MTIIKINQWAEPLIHHKGTLLEQALRRGVPYPHQCRSGECGQCKTRLISGSVRQMPCLDIALSDNERQDNLILACRSTPVTDVEVSWLDEADVDETSAAEIPVEVRSVKREGRVCRLVVALLADPSAMVFKPGQYVNFVLPGLPVRPYSMASVSGSATLEFHIEHQDNGFVSDYIARYLHAGDRFSVRGPFGDAYLRPEEKGPLVAIAAGTGLAPLVSIIRSAIITTPERRLTLIYAEREKRHQYYLEELQRLAANTPILNVQLVVSADPPLSTLHNDSITQCLNQLSYSLQDASVYIAGSPVMVESVAKTVKLLGADQHRIRADAFSRAAVQGDQRVSLVARLGRLLRTR